MFKTVLKKLDKNIRSIGAECPVCKKMVYYDQLSGLIKHESVCGHFAGGGIGEKSFDDIEFWFEEK